MSVYFKHAIHSSSFSTPLYSMLRSAKQQGQAELSAADNAALAAAEAAAAAQQEGYLAAQSHTAAGRRSNFLRELTAAASQLEDGDKADILAEPASWKELPAGVKTALPKKVNNTPVNIFFNNALKTFSDFKDAVYAMLRTAKQQGEAAQAAAAGPSGRPAKRRKGGH